MSLFLSSFSWSEKVHNTKEIVEENVLNFKPIHGFKDFTEISTLIHNSRDTAEARSQFTMPQNDSKSQIDYITKLPTHFFKRFQIVLFAELKPKKNW